MFSTTSQPQPQPQPHKPHITALPPASLPRMPVKQKMALSLKSLVSSVWSGGDSKSKHSAVTELFTKTDPAVDGDECLHDCESCSIKYPRGFKIETEDILYGHVVGWSTHLLVGTGKADWVRDVADEKGSVMEAVEKFGAPSNGVSFYSLSL